METYLFYTTHLTMFICAATVIAARTIENKQPFVKKILDFTSVISPVKKLKAIYRTLIKESKYVKTLVINILNIGMQISNQLLKQ